MVKSASSGNCIQNNNSRLSIQPCAAKKSQRWLAYEKNNTCGIDF